MSAEENKALARRFMEAVNTRNLDAFDDIIADDYVQHDPGVPPGRGGVKQFFGMFFNAFPDLHIAEEDMIADGDKVVVRWTMTGTQQGAFLGIPPTGKGVRIGGMDVWRVAGGKAAEHWATVDNLGMLQQLGVVPAPGQQPQSSMH